MRAGVGRRLASFRLISWLICDSNDSANGTINCHEIVVIWGDVDDLPPANFTSKHGVPVRFRRGLQDILVQQIMHHKHEFMV